MILTDKEAATKRCTPGLILLLMEPERRDGLTAAGAEVGTNCIGSKCMQWLYWDYVGADGKSYIMPGAAPQSKGRSTPSHSGAKEIAPRGFCSLCKHSEL